MRKPQNDPLGALTQPADPKVSERTCILTRRTAPREDLIRLALGPDGQVAPDVRARADGRGAWIGVGRAALDARVVLTALGEQTRSLEEAFFELTQPHSTPIRSPERPV